MSIRTLISLCAVFFLAACSGSNRSGSFAANATIFINGDILTMNDSAPMAEAVAIRDGKIIAVGNVDDVRRVAGEKAAIYDLSGKTLLPGLIDAHGHFGNGAFVTAMANLQPPPAGRVSNLDDLSLTLKNWSDDNRQSPWIVGMGYDESLLAEARHPTREDLDKISSDKPIMLIHVSGHFLTCNSACLAVAKITEQTKDPDGGIIRRKPGTDEPNGVLEETATQLVLDHIPQPSLRQVVKSIETYQTYYASHGITTAQEGAASPEIIKALKGMAVLGKLKLDIVAYPLVRSLADFDEDMSHSRAYKKGFRVGGIKLILDGSPQGKTAWLTRPYHVVPEGASADYAGYPTMKTDEVHTILNKAFARDIQVLAHANGDAAGDQLLLAVAQADPSASRNQRTVMIHAQTARDDQIRIMKTEGVIPSFFVAHTFYWGDWHRDSVFGSERAARISPLATTRDMGVPFTIHNDAPVVPPDMMRLVWAAVNRQTRSGQTLGVSEKITPMQALKAITLNAAYQYFEEDTKGSLEVGKRADLTLLSDNPTTIDPLYIKDIQVIETIKDGKTIFKK